MPELHHPIDTPASFSPAPSSGTGNGLTAAIGKKQMTEEDIKLRYITPALASAGWDPRRILMEKYFTDGRIIAPSKGKKFIHREGKKADYILFAADNLPIAIVEAKDNNQPVSGGIQQAIDYAKILDIPFAFSSNGDGFYEHDCLTGSENPNIPLDGFPSPEALAKRYWDSRNLQPQERKVVDTPYYFDMSTYPPRYYQRIAINRTVEAVAKGMKRALLDKYADSGVQELEKADVLDLPPFDTIGTPLKIISIFGGAAKFDAAIRELETQLYMKTA